MSFIAAAQRVFDLEIQSLAAMRDRLDESFDRAIQMMMETLNNKGKLVIMGVGKPRLISHKIAATLTSTGAPAVVLDAANAAHGDMGIIASNDLVLILTYSGKTEEITRILPALKRLQVKLIAMTGNPKSPVAREADLHLNVYVEKEACPLNLAPTSSTTTMLALGDALAMVLLDARGFKKEDFAKYHPGGTLGRNLLMKVDQIMRPLERIAICNENDSVRTGLAKISEKRCGAVIVAKKNGTLAGIYTHGDFARSFQKNPHIGDTPLREVMTPKPLVVQVDKLAVEALNIFEKNKIQDLIVLDDKQCPVGLVDVQDLTKMKLI